MSGIQLRCKVFPGAFLLYFCKPRFSIDGSYEQIVSWGENPIPVPPGRHSLRVWYNYITGPTNVADTVVDVPPEGLQVVYKTRWLVFLPGKLEVLGPGGGPAPYGHEGAYAPQGGPGPVPQQQAAAGAPGAGWNPDPSGRHQHRWWDGSQWTPTVADNGVTAEDPL